MVQKHSVAQFCNALPFFYSLGKLTTVFFFQQQLYYTSSAPMLIPVYASLGRFVFYTCHLLQARVCPAGEIPRLGMFVWNENVCQTAASSHLSVGGWWVRPPSVAPLMRHGGCVWPMLGGGWAGWLRCRCESALFPSSDAWSVSFVTADLPVFTLSPAVAAFSVLISVIMHDSVVLVGFFFPFFAKPSSRHTSLVQLFFRFTSASAGPFISI